MRQVGRDHEHFTGADNQLALTIRPEVKLQRAFEDVGDLLVLMRVPRHVNALLEVDMGNHHAIAGDQAARETVFQFFGGQFLPPVMLGARGFDGVHCCCATHCKILPQRNLSSICRLSATAWALVSFASPMMATSSACCSGVNPLLRAAAPCEAMQYRQPLVTLTAK